jgi:diaminopimelate epimerase
MHGLGNDFAIFDGRARPLAISADLAQLVADRRHGIGCDTVVVIYAGNDKADATLKFFNADGGEVESCGNASRCVARLLMDEKNLSMVTLDTRGGLLLCTDAGNGDVTVDMGKPGLEWDQVPLAAPANTNDVALDLDGKSYRLATASMGNPHAVLFVEDADQAPVESVGPRIETNELFPARTNVEFVSIRDRGNMRMRVWERGVGVTLACGTGACAAVVTSHRRGLTDRKVSVELDGGTLHIEWRASDDHVLMTGPVAEVYTGDIDLAALLT